MEKRLQRFQRSLVCKPILQRPCSQNRKNFIVFEGCNPYEIIKYPYIQKNAEEFSYNDWLSFCKTISDDLTAEEKEQLEKIKERVDNLEIDMARAAQQISDALVYPKGHVVRQEIFTILAGERW